MVDTGGGKVERISENAQIVGELQRSAPNICGLFLEAVILRTRFSVPTWSQTLSCKENGLRENHIIRVPAADLFICRSSCPDGFEV